MDRDFGPFPADLETLVRKLIIKDCGFVEAGDRAGTEIRGREVGFYRNVWLGYIRRAAQGQRFYFLIRPRSRKGRLVPVSCTSGSVERANRQYALSLTKENVADYLQFYFAFTPKEDPMLAGRGGGRLAVPRLLCDIEVDKQTVRGSDCTESCLVHGAVWHFLDERTHEKVVPLRFRRALAKQVRATSTAGRILVQFRQGVFAADFRIPQATGVPVLSREELLYESAAVREPTFPGEACLSIPKRITRYELWERLKARAARIAARLGSITVKAMWTAFALVMLYFWTCAAGYSVAEWMGWELVQDNFEWWTALLGLGDWIITGFWWTIAAIVTFLWGIVMTTHRDKIFNWIFRLAPRYVQPWIVGGLDYFVTRWDDMMIAQHTFGKRALWSLIHLVGWSAFLIPAFTSLQMLSDLMWEPSQRPAKLIGEALLLQMGLNLPFVTVVMIQLFQADWLNPVAAGILDWPLHAAFQVAVGFVVFKGLYRVWSYTVEASPYTFFRRLRTRARRSAKRPP